MTRASFSSAAQEGTVGAGGTYSWNFRVLKAGATSIVFKYYRAWEGESSGAPEDTIEYTIIVK